MHKQIAIIFICLLSLAAITGCGTKGPLYQTSEQQQENLVKSSEEADKSNEKLN